MKKNYAWVIQNVATEKFYRGGCERNASGSLSEAELQNTREDARANSTKHEVVRKVSLTKTGRPKAIIGRG